MANVIELSSENFSSQVLESTKPVLVDFWAPWCGPCQTMSPIINELASEAGEKISVGKLNVDDSPDIAETYHILTIPSFSMFVNGKIEKAASGTMEKKRLIEIFQQWLS